MMQDDRYSSQGTETVTDISPPLQLQVDVQADIRRLEGLLRWMLRLLIGCGIAVLAVASFFEA